MTTTKTPTPPVAATPATPPLTRDEKIAVVRAALRKDADSHGIITSHLATDSAILEAATTAVDAIAAAEHGKVI